MQMQSDDHMPSNTHPKEAAVPMPFVALPVVLTPPAKTLMNGICAEAYSEAQIYEPDRHKINTPFGLYVDAYPKAVCGQAKHVHTGAKHKEADKTPRDCQHY
jgi:hypothetical protein